MRGHQTTPRALAALLAASVGFIATPAFATAPAPEAKAEAKAAVQQETKQVASIKVEIRQEGGEVVKGSTQLDWNEDGTLSIEQDGTTHKLNLRVEREGTSKKLSITVAYNRGGKDIVAPYAFDAKVKKREVLRIEGNLAIAVTVTPTKVAAAKKDKGEDKPKLDISGDENDPLAGLD